MKIVRFWLNSDWNFKLYRATLPMALYKCTKLLQLLKFGTFSYGFWLAILIFFVGAQACMAFKIFADIVFCNFVYIESFYAPFYWCDTISEVWIYYWMFKHMFIATFPMNFQAWILYELTAFCWPTMAKLKFEISLRIARVSTLIPNLFSDCMKSVCWKYVWSLRNTYNDFKC